MSKNQKHIIRIDLKGIAAWWKGLFRKKGHDLSDNPELMCFASPAPPEGPDVRGETHNNGATVPEDGVGCFLSREAHAMFMRRSQSLIDDLRLMNALEDSTDASRVIRDCQELCQRL